ncbi:ATP-binding cassette domain-containing protein [bacterium]|nr:ATP-binding cassette domain-containing protein [bacterium]
MPFIEIEQVRKLYGVIAALDGLDLQIERGEVVCLSGPSGCGKTTLLRLVAGLERADEGHVRIGGEGERIRIGMVFQDFALWPHMRAARHLDYVMKGALRLSRSERRDRVRDLLDRVGLSDRARAYPSELSGGQQQRLAFARCLANDPDLLLLDEPFSNLDADLRRVAVAEIDRKRAAGATVLLATHHLEEVSELIDRVFVVKAGQGRFLVPSAALRVGG